MASERRRRGREASGHCVAQASQSEREEGSRCGASATGQEGGGSNQGNSGQGGWKKRERRGFEGPTVAQISDWLEWRGFEAARLQHMGDGLLLGATLLSTLGPMKIRAGNRTKHIYLEFQ